MVNEVIKKRKSIRRFEEGGIVTDEQIHAMLEAAMLAPSAVNSRPWSFIVVRDRKKMEEITKFHAFTQMLKTATLAIIVVANPDVLKGSKIADGIEFWEQDCGAAVQNILLQAASMNLGTCWCGLHPVKEYEIKMREIFDIEDKFVPFCVIAVGVPAEKFGARGFYEESKVRFV